MDRSIVTPPPRVLFAIGGLGLGGSERQLMQLISATHPERLRATVLTFSTDCAEEHARRLEELGVELIQLPPWGGPRAARPAVSVPRTIRMLRRVRPDVVYAWLEEASTTVTPAARSLGLPVIIARRSVCGSEAEQRLHFRLPIRWAERRARLVTGNSEAVLAEATARGVRPERLRLTRNGHRPVEALPEPGGEAVVLGYVANYRPEKGHRRLLEALPLVDARTPWRVDMAGSGPLQAEIEEGVRAKGLSDRVSAGGQITDVASFWRERHIAVLLSDDEGSPNALIEAAIRGRPSIGTDAGGTPEVIGEEGGLLVSHDPGEIAATMTRLIDDPELRRRLGEGARRRALEQHDLERFADAHLGVIEEALGRDGAAIPAR
jgi:glycosyltransferase involved in cell wall biosynthesis